MKTKFLMIAATSAAMVMTGPAFAQQASNGKQTREQARQNSQGPANANQRGIDRSNENSVLKGGDVQPGMMVHDKNGKMLGKVKEVKRAPNGTIIAIVIVLVVQINGSTQITLQPGQFTIVAGVLVAIGVTVPSGS